MKMKRRVFLKVCGLGVAGLSTKSVFGAKKRKHPNILFFFPDQHRYDWTSMNPELPDITPNLKKLARRGIHFSNAISPSPVCAPSRACLASGKEYANCRVPSNGAPYPPDQTTFYTMLKNAGYHVLGCGKFDLDKPGKSWGRDGLHKRTGQLSLVEAWGFTDGIDNEGKMDGIGIYKTKKEQVGPYFNYLEMNNLAEAYLENVRIKDHDYPGKPILPEDAYGDNWIAGNGLKLIRSVPKGEPWFIQVNFNGPHPPMDVTKSMYETWKDVKFPEAKAAKINEKGKDKGGRRNYGAMIHNIDRWLGVFLDEVGKRAEQDNTIVVYCSDHGEMLGQRGMGGKSQPWHPSACVPLFVAGPGVRKKIVCKDAVQTLDLTATFLDYAGLKTPSDMDSLSLRPYLEGRAELPRKYATSSLKGWSLVFDGRHKLIAGSYKLNDKYDKPGKDFRLYDVENDPVELNDISDEHPDIVKRLKPLLPPLSPYGKRKKQPGRS